MSGHLCAPAVDISDGSRTRPTHSLAQRFAGSGDQHRQSRYVADATHRPPRPVPKRSELGHTDQERWEVDSHGEKRDPWQFTNYLPLLAESGELFTFTTSSRGGIGAIGELCRRYSQHRKHHPDVLPMIALDVD